MILQGIKLAILKAVSAKKEGKQNMHLNVLCLFPDYHDSQCMLLKKCLSIQK